MEWFDKLKTRTRESKKRIAVIGDAMIDEWIYGKHLPSQDGCFKFQEKNTIRMAGGAANAANQLANWNCEVHLIAIWNKNKPLENFEHELSFPGRVPIKRRFISDGRIVFRHDIEDTIIADSWKLNELALKAVQYMNFDGVIFSDYDKGWLHNSTIQRIIEFCKERNIPVVADGKRDSKHFKGSIFKCNREYFESHTFDKYCPSMVVITQGAKQPALYIRDDVEFKGAARPDWIIHQYETFPNSPVILKNHVGAGDCFGMHLILGLMNDLGIEESCRLAHAAGRIYVQEDLPSPPHLHQLARDLDPVMGKVLDKDSLTAFANQEKVHKRKIVFTNGVFRMPHAGHAWLCKWAKEQGHTLVVGINDDESAKRIRGSQFVMPLQERIEIIAGWDAVDWIVPFSEPDPCAIISKLRPDVLVKGAEYDGLNVPGWDMVDKAVFPPESPYPIHCTSLENEVVKKAQL